MSDLEQLLPIDIIPNMSNSTGLFLIFIQIDDDVKIVKVDTNDIFYQAEAKYYQVLYHQNLTPEIYVYNLCRIFYPNIELSNISATHVQYSTKILDDIMQTCTNNGCFLKSGYSSNIDEFITMIKKLYEVDKFFKLSSIISTIFNHTTSNEVKNKTDQLKNIDNTIDGYSNSKVEYSFINKTNIHLLFNKYNYMGYILPDIEINNITDLNSENETEIDGHQHVYFKPLTCWNRFKLNEKLVKSLFPEIEIIDQLTDFEISDNLFLTLLNSFVNKLKNPFENKTQFEQLYDTFKKSCVSLKNKTTSNTTYPDSVELLSHIKNNYTFDNDIEHRIKFSKLLNDISNEMHIHESHLTFIKSILPQLLKELKLEKKRYSDGMYWFGIVKNNLKSDVTNTEVYILDNKFENLCRQYPDKCITDNNCDYLKTDQIKTILPPRNNGKHKSDSKKSD